MGVWIEEGRSLIEVWRLKVARPSSDMALTIYLHLFLAVSMSHGCLPAEADQVVPSLRTTEDAVRSVLEAEAEALPCAMQYLRWPWQHE